MEAQVRLKRLFTLFFVCWWVAPVWCMKQKVAELHLPLLHKAVVKQKIHNVRLLLSCNVNPDVRDAHGRTALFKAIEKNNIDLVNLLLNNKANPNAADKSLHTPLHEACKKGNIAMVALLLERGAQLHCCNTLQLTPAHIALMFKQTDLFRYLLIERNAPQVITKDGSTLMHFAASLGLLDSVIDLYKLGQSVHAVDNLGRTPLHAAVCNKDAEDVVFYLLEKGADHLAFDADHNTPVDLDESEYILKIKSAKNR